MRLGPPEGEPGLSQSGLTLEPKGPELDADFTDLGELEKLISNAVRAQFSRVLLFSVFHTYSNDFEYCRH